MTFVYPMLLGGLLLAGLPVLLHFLVRQKPKTLPFPAFRFLMQQKRTNTRKLQLRHLLLMLLRIALIVLICLALARPRLFHEPLGLSRERPVALVLLFDTSPSMDYKHNEMTRLELARKRSLELLDQLPDDCRILVVDSAEPNPMVREDWFKSLDKARQRINSLTIRPQSTSVTEAIKIALDRVDEWDRQGEDMVGQRYPRFLCVFSDRTRACWDTNLASKVEARLKREDPVKMQSLFFDVGIDEPIDLAITQLTLPQHLGAMRQSFAEGEKLTLTAVIKATGKEMAHTLTCELGDHKLEQNFNVKAGEQQTVTFEIDSAAWGLKPGLHQAEMKLLGFSDALAFNNQRHVTFQIRDKSKVLVLSDDKKARTFSRALEALLYAVESRSVHDKIDALSPYEAVFLDEVATPTDELWQLLTAYVEQGGGLGIIPPAREPPLDSYNSKAAQKAMPEEIGNKVTSLQGSLWDVAEDAKHPFLLPYMGWLKQGKADFLVNPRRAFYYWDVEPFKEGDVQVVVPYDDAGKPAVVERLWPRSHGKVILLTTPMEQHEPKWNNYYASTSYFYVALTMLCGRHLCKPLPNEKCNYLFGQDPPKVTRSKEQTSPKYVLKDAGGSEEIRFDEKLAWVGDRLPRAGNYTLSGANVDKEDLKTIAQFSINIPGEESDLSRIPVNTIEATLGKNSVIAQDRRTSLLDSIRDHWSEPLDLFPWVMILVLLLLAGENLLSNRFYRKESPAETE